MLSSKTSVKLNKALYDRARRFATKAGYSTLEEFVQHLLERELAKVDDAASGAEVEKKLRGLGYLE